jgi:hypothetical protein
MKKYFYIIIIISIFIIAGCQGDPDIVTSQDNVAQITLSLADLPGVNDTIVYVAWLYFSDDSGIRPRKIKVLDFKGGDANVLLEPDLYYLRRAQTIVLTVETSKESADSTPGLKILAGDIIGNSGEMNLSGPLSLNIDFEGVSGSYTLFTPTDTTDNSPKSGIWFLNYNNGNFTKGLNLPDLPLAGWHYEGWVEISGKLIPTGPFLGSEAVDLSDEYSGTHAQISFPGEDFLFNPPEGLTFPLDLAGAKVHITIAADRNLFNSNGIKVLSADIPGNAEPFVTYNMEMNQFLPKGSINIDINF